MTAQAAGTPEPTPRVDWWILDEPASLRFTATRTSLALRWRGRLWQVIGDPVQWSSWASVPQPLTSGYSR